MTTPLPSLPPISAWIHRFAPQISSGSSVLDVACGSGRHAHHFAARGCHVTAIDRDIRQCPPADHLTLVQADLENGSPWPVADQAFDAVIVTHYLWRPLFPHLLACLNPGGMLLYETFAQGHQHFGRPSNPDFLLESGELLRLTAPLIPVAFEQGIVENRAVMQRLCALKGNQLISL